MKNIYIKVEIYIPIRSYCDNRCRNLVLESISQFAGGDDVEGERWIRLALLTNSARRILANIASRTRFDAKLERRVAVRAKVISAARLRDRFAIF